MAFNVFSHLSHFHRVMIIYGLNIVFITNCSIVVLQILNFLFTFLKTYLGQCLRYFIKLQIFLKTISINCFCPIYVDSEIYVQLRAILFGLYTFLMLGDKNIILNLNSLNILLFWNTLKYRNGINLCWGIVHKTEQTCISNSKREKNK